MAEERVRELERRWKESGSPEDELAYLREVVRTGGSLGWESYRRLAELDVDAAAGYLLARVERGDLEREKLELAAYCSHEPARVAIGNDRWESLRARLQRIAEHGEDPERPNDDGASGPRPDDLPRTSKLSEAVAAEQKQSFEWLYPLTTWGEEACVRIALAVAHYLRDAWSPNKRDPAPWRDEALRQFDSAKAWALCPCESHRQQATSASTVRLVNWKSPNPEPRRFFARPCVAAVECLREEEAEDQRDLAIDAASVGARVLSFLRGGPWKWNSPLAPERATVRGVVADALSSWALGYDPLATATC